MILELVRQATSDDVSLIAAGPVEDFVRAHGGQYRVQIVTAARRDAKFGQALRGVWGRAAIDKQLLVDLDRIDAAPLR